MAEHKLATLLYCFFFVFVYSTTSLAHDEFISVIANSKPSVVIIEVTRAKKKLKSSHAIEELGDSAGFFEDELGDLKDQPYKSRGSGFVVETNLSKGGSLQILTAAHVVHDASKVKVLFSNGKRKTASIVWLSARNDVALLSVDAGKDWVPGLTLSDQVLLEGQSVLSIAGSFDLSVSSSLGIISALRVVLPHKKHLSLIQTDAVINPGSSGGALLNNQGEVVGLIANIYTKTGTFSGASFAVPSAVLQGLMSKQLKATN